jgi:hypothetical protein
MIRIKVEKNRNFTTINNEFIFNKDLSLKAKGLLCHLLAVPENWKLYVSEVCTWHKDGQRAVYAAFKELIAHGYVKRQQIRIKGKIQSWEYMVFEKPDVQNVYVENVDVENAHEQNAQLLNTNKTNNLIQLNTKDKYVDFLNELNINVEAWEYWKKYRKETYRATYKPMGEKAALKKLLRISNGNQEIQMKIIEQSVENGWKGFFELKKNEGTTSKIENSYNNWQEARELINKQN